MAIASSLFSPKSLLDRLRSPVFIASALSLGAHGVFFAAMPMMSASEDLQDKEESVPVVALSIEESQRLPDAVRSNNNTNAFFGDSPLVTQEGESLLPVPGIPPYGDLTGLNSGFSDPLQTTPPLWGNPVDIFQDSLPAIPGQTSVIFPETNAFDSLGSESFGIQLNDIPTPNNNIAFSNNTPIFENTPEPAPVIPAEPAEEDIALEDQPLIDGSENLPETAGPEGQIVASAGGTTIDNVFGEKETPLPEPVNPDNLAQTPLPETVNPDSLAQTPPSDLANEPIQNEPVPEPEPDPEQAPTLAGNDPALIALREEQQRLRNGYSNNGLGAADSGQVFADLGQLGTDQALELKAAQTLVAQYPDPNFKCPADSLPALFNLVLQADGNVLAPELIQSTQYQALDTAAQEAATTFAADLPEPGIYQLSVTFKDESGRCANQDIVS